MMEEIQNIIFLKQYLVFLYFIPRMGCCEENLIKTSSDLDFISDDLLV